MYPKWRSGTGMFTPELESKSTRVPRVICPESGRTNPATQFSKVVFPHPDGPSSIVKPADVSNYIYKGSQVHRLINQMEKGNQISNDEVDQALDTSEAEKYDNRPPVPLDDELGNGY